MVDAASWAFAHGPSFFSLIMPFNKQKASKKLSMAMREQVIWSAMSAATESSAIKHPANDFLAALISFGHMTKARSLLAASISGAMADRLRSSPKSRPSRVCAISLALMDLWLYWFCWQAEQSFQAQPHRPYYSA